MNEFFKNIGMWFAANKTEILSWFTVANVTGLITTISMLFKSNKTSNENKTATNNLQEGLVNVYGIKTLLDDFTNTINTLETKINSLSKIQDENDNNLKNINDKLAAILDVQSLVYSTISDDTIRKAVNNIIIKAKADETDTIVELKRRLEELQLKFTKTTTELQEKLNETVNNIPETVYVPVVEDKEDINIVRA